MGLLEISVVAVVNNRHKVRSISRLGIVWNLRRRQRRGIGIGEYGEAQFGTTVWHEVDVLRLIAFECEMALLRQSRRVSAFLQVPFNLFHGDAQIDRCIVAVERNGATDLLNGRVGHAHLLAIISVCIVEISCWRDVPAFEIWILGLLAVHVFIFLCILTHLLRDGIGIEQRPALEVDALTLESLFLYPHRQSQRDDVSALHSIRQFCERSGG